MATFFNQATLTYSGGTVSSNVTEGEIIEALSITKTATIEEYSQGTQVTYILNVINTGSVPYTGLSITDDLGAYPFDTTTLIPLTYVDGSVTYFINGVLQPDPTVTLGDEITISPISVPAGGNATIAYTATANSFASPLENGTIVNTATLTDNGTTIATATETISTFESPVLSISKTLSPTTVTANEPVTYTFTIENTGNAPADAADSIVITDTFNPALTSVVVTYNGTVWTEGVEYTYDEATGAFQTTAGAITVPAATFTQNTVTGEWTSTPGTSTLTVTGNIA